MLRRGLAIYLAAAAIVLGGAALVLPTLVTDEVEQRVRDRLAREGVEARWRSFTWDLRGHVRVQGLELRAPGRGVAVEADRLDLVVPLRAALDGRIEIEEVTLTGAGVRLDPDALRPAAGATASTSRAAGSGLGERLLGAPPRVALRDVIVSVVRADTQIARVLVDEGTVEPEEGGLRVVAAGSSTLSVPQLPVAADGTHPWRVSARVEPVARRVSMTLEGRDGPLLTLDEPGRGSLRVGAVTVEADLRSGALRLAADEVRAAVPGAEAELGRVTARRGDDGRLLLHGEDGTLTVDAARLRGAGSGGGTGTGGAGELRLLDRVAASGADLRVVLRDGERLVTLADEVDAWWVDDQLSVGGAALGGTFDLTATFLPGQRRPHHLALHLARVDPDRLLELRPPEPALPVELLRHRRAGGLLDVDLVLVSAAADLDRPLLAGPTLAWVDLTLSGGFVEHGKISEAPLTGIAGRARALVRWLPAEGHLELLDGAARAGAVTARFSASVADLPEDPVIEGRVALDEVDCQKALDAVPRALLGPYDRLTMEGRFAPSLTWSLPVHRPQEMDFKVQGLLLQCAVTALNGRPEARPPVKLPGGKRAATARLLDDVEWLNRPFVMRVTEGVSEGAVVEVGPGLSSYVPLGELPRYVGAAAYLSEEVAFYEGTSINLGLIRRGLRLNLEHGRYVYGGSTVTQQLVKNLFLTRDKTLARKFREGLIAARVTDQVSKDRILELYLNCIEFGPDIYGIGPAARYYFGKDARALTPREAVFLAMLKPAPRAGAMFKRRGRTPHYPYWTRRAEELFRRLVEYGFLTQAQADAERPYDLAWDVGGRYLERAPVLREVPEEPVVD